MSDQIILSVRFPVEEAQEIDATCKRLGMSRSDLMRSAILQFLQHSSLEELSAQYQRILLAKRDLEDRLRAAARAFGQVQRPEKGLAVDRTPEEAEL